MSRATKARKNLSKRSYQATNNKGRTMDDILKIPYPKLDLRVIATKNLFT